MFKNRKFPVLVGFLFFFIYFSSLVSHHEVFAHPFLIDSVPKSFQIIQSPDKIELFFSEPIELKYSKVAVYDPEGNRVDVNSVKNVGNDPASLTVDLQQNLPDGTYTIQASVLSAIDGHLIDHAVIFGIGKTDPNKPSFLATNTTGSIKISQSLFALDQTAARFPGYLGQIIVLGAAIVSILLVGPLNNVEIFRNMLLENNSLLNNKLIWLFFIGIGFVIISGLVLIIVQSLTINASIIETIQTKFGVQWFIRMILTSLLLSFIIYLYKKSKDNKKFKITKLHFMIIIGLTLPILGTYSLISHAAATNNIPPIILDFIHGIAASIWIGGLILIFTVYITFVTKRIDNEEPKYKIMTIIIPRFSSIVVPVLGMILITGPLLLWSLEKDIETTILSTYGKILFIKLIFGSIMIGFGAYHQFITSKKVKQIINVYHLKQNKDSVYVTSNPDLNDIKNKDDSNRKIKIRKKVKDNLNISSINNLRINNKIIKILFIIEIFFGIALLLMVSVMTNMTLPSGENQKLNLVENNNNEDVDKTNQTVFRQTAYTSNGKIQLVIDPLTIGQNKFEIKYFNTDKDNTIKLENVSIKLTEIEKGIGPIKIDGTETSENSFIATGALSLSGLWKIEIQGITNQKNVSNQLAVFDVVVKPKLSDYKTEIKEFKTPEDSLPLFPIFDKNRQSIWIGDSKPNSSRIWQYNLQDENFIEHKINDSFLITLTAIDSQGNIWYADPTKYLIGKYNPITKENKQTKLPYENGIIAGLIKDGNENLWISLSNLNKLVKYNIKNNTFTSYDIPTANARPGAITYDEKENLLWIAESIGKIARIDPVNGNIIEFSNENEPLEEPTFITPDPNTQKVYISEHEGKKISVLDPINSKFNSYNISNNNALPFGMAIDKYGNLWFAEHVIDKIGIIDPDNGESIEKEIPINGSFIQYILSDDTGDIWFAAQRSSSIGHINISYKPSMQQQNIDQTINNINSQESTEMENQLVSIYDSNTTSFFGIDINHIISILVAIGLMISAFLYARNVLELKNNIRKINDINLDVNRGFKKK